MEAPLPKIYEDQKSIKKEIPLNNDIYILQIKNKNDNLTFKVESKNIENLDYFYEIKYELNDLYKLSRYFRQFDNFEEVIESLKNNENIMKEKKSLKSYELEFTNHSMALTLNLYLMSGKVESLNIQLNKEKYNDKEIIFKLKEYIKAIKNIPEINNLIEKYFYKKENHLYKNKKIKFIEKSNIIPKIEDFYFIGNKICENLNKKEIKLTLKFSALKNGDTSAEFHRLCDNIGPNITIVQTKDNLVFGGFTMNNWSGNGPKKDNLAFLFNIQNKKIYPIRREENAIYCGNGWLSNFYHGKGGAASLHIANNFFLNDNNTCDLKDTSFEGFNSDYELNNGNLNFKILNLEIYEIN
jgi:hypothetical protein